MYTRIALGKNSTMDVVAGDGVGAHGQLVFLYPLLFLLQVRVWRGVEWGQDLWISMGVCWCRASLLARFGLV